MSCVRPVEQSFPDCLLSHAWTACVVSSPDNRQPVLLSNVQQLTENNFVSSRCMRSPMRWWR